MQKFVPVVLKYIRYLSNILDICQDFDCFTEKQGISKNSDSSCSQMNTQAICS